MNGRQQEVADEVDHGEARGQLTYRNASGTECLEILKCTPQALREFRRNHISMVFQQFGLMPWQTVKENVAFPLELKKRPRSEINRAVAEKIELVGLTAWGDRYPHELSGGMKQRVGLARAFVTETDILLMDEPFSALDPYHRGRLQKEILHLQNEMKKTIVFVTHDPAEALLLADRIAIMESGEILQLDTPENCVAHPVSDAVKRIISA
jgi:glycine betaine/proline transport system ATP-binding protein